MQVVQCDFNDLPHKCRGQNVIIDWKGSVGKQFRIKYNHIDDYVMITKHILNNDNIALVLKYKDREKKFTLSNIINGHFVSLFKDLYLYQSYQIGEIITCNNGHRLKITAVSMRKKKNTESKCFFNIYYKVQCKKCGHSFYKNQSGFLNNGCPCCSGRIASIGINDITTTAPWMIKYFPGGAEEASKYTKTSSILIKPICPYCHKQRNKPISISNLYQDNGFLCECSNRNSYPERFISVLLSQLCIPYYKQASKNQLGFLTNKLYDFYIENKSCIIETHGRQHYQESHLHQLAKKTLKDEQENDAYKERLAKENGIKHYIVLDCRKSNIEWIKKSVLESELPALFNFTENDIDWVKCHEMACNNIMKTICLDYQRNFLSINVLSQKYKLCNATIYKYLKIGNDLNWCQFDKTKQRYKSIPIQVFKNDNLLLTCETQAELQKLSTSTLGVFINTKTSSKCLKNNAIYKGFKIKRPEDPKEIFKLLYGFYLQPEDETTETE